MQIPGAVIEPSTKDGEWFVRFGVMSSHRNEFPLTRAGDFLHSLVPCSLPLGDKRDEGGRVIIAQTANYSDDEENATRLNSL